MLPEPDSPATRRTFVATRTPPVATRRVGARRKLPEVSVIDPARSPSRLFAVCLVVALVATTPVALAAPQEDGPATEEEIVGTYTVDVPDFGLITIEVRHREEDGAMLISATEQPETVMTHVEDNRYEIDTDMYGVILIEFRENEEGVVTSMTLDSYEFSLLAEKKRVQ